MAMPPYIEYGGRVSSPAPFLTTGGTLRAIPLKADPVKLDAIVDRTLNGPAQGSVEYRAIGGTVLLQLGGFDAVRCTLPPFDTWGTVEEVQASFWIPVVQGKEQLGSFVADRFGMTAPYVIVDNPMSYVGGRDVYGYAKSQGKFTPADGIGEKASIKVYGGDFTANNKAKWRPFLEVEAITPAPGAAAATLAGAAQLAAEFMPGFLQAVADDSDLVLPGFKLQAQLLQALAKGQGNQIFLKQFRDAADGTKACYQAIVEGPVTVSKVNATPTGRTWRVTFHDLDSHPIGDELGLKTQDVTGGFDVEIDFTVEPGVEVAP
jgi:hypothetical protein